MKYRKYLEPVYGEAAPCVRINQPQIMDMDDPAGWRNKANEEGFAAETEAMKQCVCYPGMMRVHTEDLVIRQNGHEVPVRIYRKGMKGKAPLVVFFHGGSYSMNNLDVYDYVCRYLAYSGGLTVLSVQYGLAPEHKFPEGLEDAYEATVWAAAHGEEFGGDTGLLYVCGDSSGGNFAAAVAMMARDRKGPQIRGQALIYPVTTNYSEERTQSEIRYGKGYFLEYDSTEKPSAFPWYFRNPEDVKNPYASPLLAEDLRDLPPACFIAAECDPLLDQGLMYAARMEDAGVKVEYHLYRGMIHAFLNEYYEKTFDALDKIAEFVNAGTGKTAGTEDGITEE